MEGGIFCRGEGIGKNSQRVRIGESKWSKHQKVLEIDNNGLPCGELTKESSRGRRNGGGTLMATPASVAIAQRMSVQ